MVGDSENYSHVDIISLLREDFISSEEYGKNLGLFYLQNRLFFFFYAHFVFLFVLFIGIIIFRVIYFYVKKITHNLSFQESKHIRHSLRERFA